MTPIVAGFLASGGVGAIIMFFSAIFYNHNHKALDMAQSEKPRAISDGIQSWGGVVAVPPPPDPIYPCVRCYTEVKKSNTRCADCEELCKHARKSVTEFDFDMPCPWCDAEGPHHLRESHPAPKFESMPELRHKFAAFKKDTGMLEQGYAQYVRRNADVVIEAFGERHPVRVVMNDAAAEAHARTLRPPRVSLDSPQLSKYDHPEAKVIRTCINADCGKEWSQK